MKIDKKQLQTLQKLSEKGTDEICFTDEDLIISVYLPEFWKAESDDESLFHRRMPEYIAAKKVYSKSIKSLIDAGLIEVQESGVSSEIGSPSTSFCNRITQYGRQALDILN